MFANIQISRPEELTTRWLSCTTRTPSRTVDCPLPTPLWFSRTSVPGRRRTQLCIAAPIGHPSRTRCASSRRDNPPAPQGSGFPASNLPTVRIAIAVINPEQIKAAESRTPHSRATPVSVPLRDRTPPPRPRPDRLRPGAPQGSDRTLSRQAPPRWWTIVRIAPIKRPFATHSWFEVRRTAGNMSHRSCAELALLDRDSGTVKRSTRSGLMRRRSPRRKVTPWRSKNSRI
jgi:hypothetical protein